MAGKRPAAGLAPGSAGVSLWSKTYSYDANDNRLTLEQRTNKTAATPTTTLTSTITTGTNRLASVAGGTATRQLSYDGRGNIGGDVRGTETNTALYDAYGRLNSYAKTAVSTWVMKYNGGDERVEVRIGTGTPRRFVYDEDGRLIGEYGNTVATSIAGLWAEHAWLTPAASDYGEVWGGYEPLALVGPSTTSWVHGDNLGRRGFRRRR